MNLMLDERFDTMPWDELDAVVFDVGNVLLSFEPEAILREYLPDSADLYPVLMRKVFRSPYWTVIDHGAMPYDEIVEAMIGRDSHLEEPIRVIMANWVKMKHIIDEGVQALQACKAHGKKLYVLSNYGKEPFSVVENKYDFFRLFDGKVVSARVHMMKPDPAIYRYVTDTYHLDPARTLFIDDAPGNIEMALALGWQGICYNEKGKLTRFMQLD